MTARTVDLTRQRALMTPYPGSRDATVEIWLQDAMVRILHLLGIERVQFDDDPPSDTRWPWFDRGTPASGQPGVLKLWDGGAEAWLPITPASYKLFSSKTIANYTYRQDDPPLAPNEGDRWVIESEGRIYLWLPVSATEYAWLDISGAPFDFGSITGPSTDEGNIISVGSDGRPYLSAATVLGLTAP